MTPPRGRAIRSPILYEQYFFVVVFTQRVFTVLRVVFCRYSFPVAWWEDAGSFEAAVREHGSIKAACRSLGGIGPTKARKLRDVYGLSFGRMAVEQVPSSPDDWWREKDVLFSRVMEHGSQTACARAHGVSQGVLSKWWNLHGLPSLPSGNKKGEAGESGVERPGVVVEGDRARLVTEPGSNVDLGDLDGILRDRGLSPDDWVVERLVVNEWDAVSKDDDGEPVVTTLRQLKAFLKRRVVLPWVLPAVEVEERWRPSETLVKPAGGWLQWVGGDQQAGYHDAVLHEAVCRWLADVQPDGMSLVGDTLDLPTISRHMDSSWNLSVQQCIDQGYRLLSDYRDAAPGSVIKKLRGNHDFRLESELLTRAERMFGVRPAEEDVPALSLRRLLHLDKLGIELVGGEGDDWRLAEIWLSEEVVVRHDGPKPNARRVQADVISGHDHRQGIVFQTEWVSGNPVVYANVRCGTLAMTRGGLGYAKDPDWQPGFATCTLRPDGSRHYELATWRGGKLHWRGETW